MPSTMNVHRGLNLEDPMTDMPITTTPLYTCKTPCISKCLPSRGSSGNIWLLVRTPEVKAVGCSICASAVVMVKRVFESTTYRGMYIDTFSHACIFFMYNDTCFLFLVYGNRMQFRAQRRNAPVRERITTSRDSPRSTILRHESTINE